MTKKYQQGGSAQDELNQFAQDIIQNQLFGEDTEAKLQQLAKEQPKVIQQLFQIWKQAGIEGVVKALQQAQKAAKGAKLNRVMALSNRCPQGYMKKGGKCKKCEKGNKLDPTKGVFHIKSYFRNGGRTIPSKAIGGGFNWAEAAKATAEAVGQGLQSMYQYKAKQKELETQRDINNSNNNAAIALAGAKNDLMRNNMMYNNSNMWNFNKKPYMFGYQNTYSK